MTINNTPNIKRDNDPDSVWDSTELNKELSRLDKSTESLTKDLVTVDTEQTIESQKTFFQFYPKETNLVSYNDMMKELPYNLSPVFGASDYHFQATGCLEEGNYDKPRGDGFRFDAAAVNPLYFKAQVYIKGSPSSIFVDCSNVPVPFTGISSTTINPTKAPLYYKTSISYTGTIPIFTFGTSILLLVSLLYNTETGVVTPHAGRLNSAFTYTVPTTSSKQIVVPIGIVTNSAQSRQVDGVSFMGPSNYINLFSQGVDLGKIFKSGVLLRMRSAQGGFGPGVPCILSDLFGYNDGYIMYHPDTYNSLNRGRVIEIHHGGIFR